MPDAEAQLDRIERDELKAWCAETGRMIRALCAEILGHDCTYHTDADLQGELDDKVAKILGHDCRHLSAAELLDELDERRCRRAPQPR
jgi:hypothetical protein